MSAMDVERQDGKPEVPDEGFTVAQLKETPEVPRGAVRDPCRWFGLAMLVFGVAIFVGVCIAEVILPPPGH